MSSKIRSRHAETAKKLPLSTSELMLGVKIDIHPEAMFREMHSLGKRGGLSPEIKIHSVGGESLETDLVAGSRTRTYLASWARRNLFQTDDMESDQ